MEILFPGERAPDGRMKAELEAMLAMLTGDDTEVLNIQKFPLILAWPNAKFRYVGRMILTKGRNHKPVALAREAYGQHIINMLYDVAAGQVVDQTVWLSERAAE